MEQNNEVQELNEAQGSDSKRPKKITLEEIKPVKTVMYETYKLSLKEMEVLFRKTFDLEPEDKIRVYLSEAKYGKLFEVEIERNR